MYARVCLESLAERSDLGMPVADPVDVGSANRHSVSHHRRSSVSAFSSKVIQSPGHKVTGWYRRVTLWRVTLFVTLRASVNRLSGLRT